MSQTHNAAVAVVGIARLRPFNRHTLEPAAAASRCKLDASVTIRPLIPTPIQQVSLI